MGGKERRVIQMVQMPAIKELSGIILICFLTFKFLYHGLDELRANDTLFGLGWCSKHIYTIRSVSVSNL
jgi:hypothetical protein